MVYPFLHIDFFTHKLFNNIIFYSNHNNIYIKLKVRFIFISILKLFFIINKNKHDKISIVELLSILL